MRRLLTPDEIQQVKDYRARTGCTLVQARDAVVGHIPPPPSVEESEIASLRASLASVTKERDENERMCLGYQAAQMAAEAVAKRYREALREIAAEDRQEPENDDGDATCAECHSTVQTEDGLDPAPECWPCSTTILRRDREIARRALAASDAPGTEARAETLMGCPRCHGTGVVPMAARCACTHEAGDSPCPVHGMNEGAASQPAESEEESHG